MDRSTVWVGSLTGFVLVAMTWTGYRVHAADEAALAVLRGRLDEISKLEARVAAYPGDVAGRMALAETCVAKLMTTSGPEQGLWGGRAEEQWSAVVNLDDGHWGAHSSLGTN